MDTIPALLAARLRAILPEADPRVSPATDPRFGDYQTNVAMVQARLQRTNPRLLAQTIIDQLDVADLCDPPETAGAGFINFRLRPDWLAERFRELSRDERLGVPPPATPRRFVIDFSGPNVAKPMHIGHIRSTILGDALARIASFIGHEVVRDNHIGDWGTQFGMLLAGWKGELDREALAADPLTEMERIYKLISARSKTDPATLGQVHQELVKLQSGDEENLRLWHEMIRLSQAQFDSIYTRLDIRFDVSLGESFYNPRLKPIVQDLQQKGIARESDGALCVFSDGATAPEQDPFLVMDKDGWRPNPALVQKSDGASNYTTTDLATLQYRQETWQPTDILYVTDGRQQLHFRQLFAITQRWQPQTARLTHVWFGAILGDDGTPFKTRSGDTIRLRDLLDEAEERAHAIVTSKNPDVPEAERRGIARIVGLGAIKYADLLPNRQSDYTFSWDKMLALTGNTAPYLQYSYVRIRSIFRKAEASGKDLGGGDYLWPEPAEQLLAKKLLQFGEAVPQVLEDFRPNQLATYLFELAGTFHSFFEACPVLKAEEPIRTGRLLLCDTTARALKTGLGLLGIEVPERM